MAQTRKARRPSTRKTTLTIYGVKTRRGEKMMSGPKRWSRLSEQNFRVDKWSLCRG